MQEQTFEKFLLLYLSATHLLNYFSFLTFGLPGSNDAYILGYFPALFLIFQEFSTDFRSKLTLVATSDLVAFRIK